MRVKLLGIKGNWREVADSARTTIGAEAGEGTPKSEWKRRMILAEHSPIRQITIKWKWYYLLSWVSVHFVRHWVGIVHWVRTQRTDRTGVDRTELSQSEMIEHECEANIQAIINISRKRLCRGNASPETREAWKEFLQTIKYVEPEVYNASVPDCVYRGWCYEYNSCNYHKSPAYQLALKEYREGINE